MDTPTIGQHQLIDDDLGHEGIAAVDGKCFLACISYDNHDSSLCMVGRAKCDALGWLRHACPHRQISAAQVCTGSALLRGGLETGGWAEHRRNRAVG